MRVGAAVLVGALVGLERERKHRPAGFRTMILISLGSCGFLLIGYEAMAQLALAANGTATHAPGMPAPGQAEISRILQGLIGGIGFLGAGAVIQNKKAVRGVTTAAAVWVVAALGAACGLGQYVIAIILGLASLFTLIVLEYVENKYFPDPDDGNGWFPDKKSGKKNAESGDSSAVADQLRGDETPEDNAPQRMMREALRK